MNTIECIKSRASVRSFKPEKVSDRIIDEILDAATRAPSAGNVQDWEFVVVSSQDTKSKLVEAAFEQEFISQAPVVIVVCSNLRRISNAYGERGTSLYAIQNTANATQNMLLAAWEKGLGSCWVGAFNEVKVREALVLPEDVRPMAIVPLGYPASQPAKTGRRKPREVVHKDFY
jgi:nitroreductase